MDANRDPDYLQALAPLEVTGTTMKPSERYRTLARRLVEREAREILTEAERGALRQEMDSISWAMTESERAAAGSVLQRAPARQ